MHIVYVCRRGNQNQELRWSLRSIAQHVEHDSVTIVGEPPGWVRGAQVIRLPQNADKFTNVTRSLLHVCRHRLVPDEFALFNDDFYALRPTGIPTWHRGHIDDVIASRRPRSSYVAGMTATRDWLRASGVRDPLSYELHVPMMMRREQLLEVLRIVTASPVYLHRRTLYGNLSAAGGALHADVKIHDTETPLPVDAEWVSSNDHIDSAVFRGIRAAFPEAGPYEGLVRPIPAHRG